MNLKFFSDPRDAENFEPFPIVFSRASVAYEGNGASLASNQPGFISGEKGVYGLGVYEQYSNILTSSLSQDFNEAWTSGTLNGTYTIKIGSGGGSITLSGGATGTVTSGNSLTFTVTSSTVTFTPTGTCLNTIIINKPYPLPWILGGTTRQPEQAHIPAHELKKFMKLEEGNIEVIFNLHDGMRIHTVDNHIFRMLGTSWNRQTIQLGITSMFFLGTGNDSDYTHITKLIETNGVRNISVSYNQKELSFIDGKSTPKVVTNPKLPLRYEILHIGGFSQTAGKANTNIKQMCFSTQRTIEDRIRRQLFAEANGYYQIDDKVQAFLDLESGLRAYRRTTQ